MAENLIIHTGSKEEKYRELLPQLHALVSTEADLIANLANMAAALKQTFGFFWVGFYLVKEEELVLGPFQGPIACTRIRFGRGVCGTAWKEARTLIVPDVEQFPGHIACSSDSKSEIVVPILKQGKVAGVLDIDSDTLDSFDTIDARYLEEICEGQAQINQGSMMGLSYDQLDISTADMEDVDLYMQSLGVPARRNINDPQVILGEQKFYEAKCHLCHVTTLHTQAGGSTLLNGTRLPWLGGQTIHPYSDFLLHDMGSEIMGVGLNDNYVSGLARGNEWRTTPLWGIGLQEKVNGHTYFLHDGRARNLTEAIMWHGGEGEASKNLFKQMSKEEREAVIAFLNSL